jgi:hypothetical protein
MASTITFAATIPEMKHIWQPASPRPPFLEPEPVSPRATKRAKRAAEIARWRKANGWTGPFVRFAREDDDDF